MKTTVTTLAKYAAGAIKPTSVTKQLIKHAVARNTTLAVAREHNAEVEVTIKATAVLHSAEPMRSITTVTKDCRFNSFRQNRLVWIN